MIEIITFVRLNGAQLSLEFEASE